MEDTNDPFLYKMFAAWICSVVIRDHVSFSICNTQITQELVQDRKSGDRIPAREL
jgi:hypothetical protein